VAEKEVTLENLAYAESVLGRWQIRAKYPELKKAVGKHKKLWTQ
jgi:hypothetical protein